MSVALLLDRRLTLQRATAAPDASGGSTRTFANLIGLPCSVQAVSSKVAADYARRDLVVDHHVFTNVDLDSAISGGVRLGDRLTDGIAVYLVQGVLKSANANVTADIIFQLDCTRRLI